MDLQCGDLVRCVYDYNIYAAYDDGLVGYDPSCRHGVVMEVSKTDSYTIAVFCYDCQDINWMLVNTITDEVEILSRGYSGYDE